MPDFETEAAIQGILLTPTCELPPSWPASSPVKLKDDSTVKEVAPTNKVSESEAVKDIGQGSKAECKPYSIEAITMPTQPQQVTKPSVVTIKPTELPLNLLDSKPAAVDIPKVAAKKPIRRDSIPIPSASTKVISPTTIPTKVLLKPQLEVVAPAVAVAPPIVNTSPTASTIKPKRRSMDIPRPTTSAPSIPKPSPITPVSEINGKVFDFDDDDQNGGSKKIENSIKRRRNQQRNRKNNDG